jgi:hypothetical protein
LDGFTSKCEVTHVTLEKLPIEKKSCEALLQIVLGP